MPVIVKSVIHIVKIKVKIIADNYMIKITYNFYVIFTRELYGKLSKILITKSFTPYYSVLQRCGN